ncbi:hypothetical protein D3C87_2047120 [compost metagenome]
MIFGGRPLQHVEFHIAGHLGQTALAVRPHGLEGLLVAGHDPKTVHRNKHG